MGCIREPGHSWPWLDCYYSRPQPAHSEFDSSSETKQQPDTAAADTSPAFVAAAHNTGFVAPECYYSAGIGFDSTLLGGPKMRPAPGADPGPGAPAWAPETGLSFHTPVVGIAAEQHSHSVGGRSAADCSPTDSTASRPSCSFCPPGRAFSPRRRAPSLYDDSTKLKSVWKWNRGRARRDGNNNVI